MNQDNLNLENRKHEQVLKITHEIGLSQEQISERLRMILGDPRDSDDLKKRYLMAETIHSGMSRPGSMSTEDSFRLGDMIRRIKDKIKKCCKTQTWFSNASEKWDTKKIEELIIVSELARMTLAKYQLIIQMSNKICDSCQELRENLTKFLQERDRENCL